MSPSKAVRPRGLRRRNRRCAALTSLPFCVFALTLLTATQASAATAGWIGAAGASWSDPDSWSSNAPPINGDTVDLPAAPEDGQSSQDDIPAVALSEIAIEGAWTVERRKGAVVDLDGPFTVDLSGQEPTGEGHELVWLVPLHLSAATAVRSTYGAGIVTIRAPLTGGQSVTAFGPGQILLQASDPSDIGSFTVDGASSGRADFYSPDTAPGALTIENGGAAGFGTGVYSTLISVGGDGTAETTIPSSWAPGALRIPSNHQESSPVFAGPVTVTAPTVFATSRSDDDSSLTFDGPLSGPFPVTLTGAGAITLNGATTVATLVSQVSRLSVNGPSTAAMQVDKGSAIQGSGTVGGLDLQAGATLQATVGDGRSPLTSTGPVTVGGSLGLSVTGLPPVGSVVTILSDTSGLPVDGVFDGLPEGAVIDSDDAHWQISYHGGVSGYDVTLERIAQVDVSVADQTGTATAGQTVTTTIPVNNNGPEDAVTDLVITPPTGTAFTFVPSGCIGPLTGPLTCRVAVTAGATVYVQVDIAVPTTVADATTLTGSMTLLAVPGYQDTSSTDNIATLALVVTAATGGTTPPVSPTTPTAPTSSTTSTPTPTSSTTSTPPASSTTSMPPPSSVVTKVSNTTPFPTTTGPTSSNRSSSPPAGTDAPGRSTPPLTVAPTTLATSVNSIPVDRGSTASSSTLQASDARATKGGGRLADTGAPIGSAAALGAAAVVVGAAMSRIRGRRRQ